MGIGDRRRQLQQACARRAPQREAYRQLASEHVWQADAARRALRPQRQRGQQRVLEGIRLQARQATVVLISGQVAVQAHNAVQRDRVQLDIKAARANRCGRRPPAAPPTPRPA